MRLFNCFRSSRSVKIKPISDTIFDVNITLAEISPHSVMSLDIHKSILLANLKSFLSSNILYKIDTFLDRMYSIEMTYNIYCFFNFNLDSNTNELNVSFLLIKNPSKDTFIRKKMECAESIFEVSKLYKSFNRNNVNINNLELFVERTSF